MDGIMELAKKYDLKVIENVAQAVGVPDGGTERNTHRSLEIKTS